MAGCQLALGKAVIFVALVLVVGVRVLPWLLNQITRTRSRELFLLAVVTLAAGTAYGAYELFGVGFALGAFLAGVVMGGTSIKHQASSIKHQIEAEIGPFRDIFAVLFFVSVGMQVDIGVIGDQFDKVIVLTAAIVVGKAIITLALSFLMPKSGRELAVVAGGLSQIGEFSFIVGQAGLTLALLDAQQYALILAAAVVSITVNPAMYSAIPHFEALLSRLPYVGTRMRDAEPGIVAADHHLSGHVVVIGYGRIGTQTAKVLRELDYGVLVVDLDAPSVERAENDGLLALFGDASNSDILTHAGLKEAKALVVTLPNHTSTELVVAAAHQVAPALAIVARAGLFDGVQRLHDLGARHVINPELEGGLEIVRHTLFELDYPMSQLGPYVDAVRREAYQGRFDNNDETAESMRVLDQLLTAVRGVDIVWHPVPESSPLAGTTLGSSRLRARTGASVVALLQRGEVQLNPDPDTTFVPGDLIGLIGNSEELAAAGELLTTGAEPASA